MSVVTSLTAVPNRMVIVWRYLCSARGSEAEEGELARLIRPASLQNRHTESDEGRSDAMFSEVLNEMIALGLIERAAGGTLNLSPQVPNGDETRFLTFVEERLIDPVAAERHGQGKLPKAIAWFLVQDPSQPLIWGRNYRDDVTGQCGAESGAFDLTTSARFQQFVYWARYLGFGWRLEMQGMNVVFPDPTAAIERHLSSVINGKRSLPISEFMASLARLLPVLEGGAAREEVESQLTPRLRRVDGDLSHSTSLALERLESQGLIRMERLADAPGINLVSASGARVASHVTRRDGG